MRQIDDYFYYKEAYRGQQKNESNDWGLNFHSDHPRGLHIHGAECGNHKELDNSLWEHHIVFHGGQRRGAFRGLETGEKK